MNVSLWGIRNPLPAAMVFVVLCIIGIYGWRQLPISQLPDIALPQVRVTVNLSGAKGVGKVARVGGVDREVQVDLDSARLAALGVTAGDISSLLRQVQQDASGGRGDIGSGIQSVRTLAAVGTVAEIAALKIPLSGGRSVRLGEVAKVRDGVAERSTITLLDGQPVVSFEVTRIKGASEVAVAEAVRQAVAKLQAQHPQLQIEEAFNTVAPVQDNFDGSMELLFEGAFLAILVVWWFLRDWRATLVSAAALPLSIIPTFAAMYYFDFSLNTLTLLALALVVGILVDDAIVEIENIVRHLRMGKTPIEAATEAADEIGLAVIATTFTLVAVFLPTAFMGGVPGKFFKQFGITAAVSVLASLLVARLLTPMMAAYFEAEPRRAAGADPGTDRGERTGLAVGPVDAARQRQERSGTPVCGGDDPRRQRTGDDRSARS
jgi:multidrug efflux pump subunit AcrB